MKVTSAGPSVGVAAQKLFLARFWSPSGESFASAAPRAAQLSSFGWLFFIFSKGGGHSTVKGSALTDPIATSRLVQTIADTSLAIGTFLRHSMQYHFWRCCVKRKRGRIPRVKYWESIADNLKKAGWSLGCTSAVAA